MKRRIRRIQRWLWTMGFVLVAIGVCCSRSTPEGSRPRGPADPFVAPMLPSVADEPHKDTIAVLLIAVQSPQSLPGDADPLHHVANDARQLTQDFRGLGVPDSNITLLEESAATASAVMAKLDALAGQLEPSDTLFIVFLGHGVGRDTAEMVLYDKQVPVRELLDRLARSAARAVLISDACHSGRPGSPQFALTPEQVKREGGVAWISSAAHDQHAFESDEFQRGVFSHYLSEILQDPRAFDTNADDALSLDEIGEQLQKKVADWCRRTGEGPQEPHFRYVDWNGSSRLILLPRKWELKVLDAGQVARVELQFSRGDVGEDERIVLLVEPAAVAPRYYPQDSEISNKQIPPWTGTVHFGAGPEHRGEQFRVCAVVADRELMDRWNSIPRNLGTVHPRIEDLKILRRGDGPANKVTGSRRD